MVHTANINPQDAMKFDKTFPHRIIRSSFIRHVQEVVVHDQNQNKIHLILGKLRSLIEYFCWPIVALQLILRERPDIVHIGEHNFSGIAAWLAQRFLGIPYIFYTYAEEIPILSQRPIHNKIFLSILRNADKVISCNEYTRKKLIGLGVPSEDIIKILPAVSEKKKIAVTSEQIESVRRKYQLKNHKILLTVGALIERKGHSTVISILPIINRSFYNTKYIIVGNGPRREDLFKQVEVFNLSKQVIIIGNINDIELSSLYELCDIFVMPHREVKNTLDTEGCPTVFLEASAHGKPVIGGNVGGVGDAIINEKTGYIIDGTDKVALADVIINLLSDNELSNKMGKAGQRYTSLLTPERNAQKIWDLSKSLMK